MCWTSAHASAVQPRSHKWGSSLGLDMMTSNSLVHWTWVRGVSTTGGENSHGPDKRAYGYVWFGSYAVIHTYIHTHIHIPVYIYKDIYFLQLRLQQILVVSLLGPLHQNGAPIHWVLWVLAAPFSGALP